MNQLDDPAKRGFEEEPAREKRSPVPGFIILGSIVVICVMVAYYLSTLMVTDEEPARRIFPDRTEMQTPGDVETDQDTTEPPEEAEVQLPDFTREGIEAVNAQIRGLGEISDSVTSFRMAENRYPRDIDELIDLTGLELPENPYDPDVTAIEVEPGEFYPGGFTYLPFYSRREGPIEGFVLLGYAADRDGGTTIDRPADLVWPYIFDPPIEEPIPSVSVAMGEGRQLIDISDFTETTSEEREHQL